MYFGGKKMTNNILADSLAKCRVHNSSYVYHRFVPIELGTKFESQHRMYLGTEWSGFRNQFLRVISLSGLQSRYDLKLDIYSS